VAFLLKRVLVPLGSFTISIFVLMANISYHKHGHFPLWLADALKLALAVI
jgi:hypothetical protein